jgi:hypothetical protein
MTDEQLPFGGDGQDIPDEELDDREQTVLIRICEWTEWIPGSPDPASGKIFVHNGVTSFMTTQAEKLVDVSLMNTGQKLDWTEEVECEDCDATGRKSDEVHGATEAGQVCEICEGAGYIDKAVHYGLYAMQATLAVNVSPQLVSALMAAQNLAMVEEQERRREQGRDKRADITVVERGKERPNRPRPRKKRR